MSQDEQDAAVGRIVRERKEFNQKMEKLKAQAMKHASFLKNLASTLESRPDQLAFDGVSTGADSMVNARRFEAALYPQLQDIADIGNEMRETMEQQRRLEERAVRLGV
jgi:DNA repair exonuclease SbcCD ATPase subunit